MPSGSALSGKSHSVRCVRVEEALWGISARRGRALAAARGNQMRKSERPLTFGSAARAVCMRQRGLSRVSTDPPHPFNRSRFFILFFDIGRPSRPRPSLKVVRVSRDAAAEFSSAATDSSLEEEEESSSADICAYSSWMIAARLACSSSAGFESSCPKRSLAANASTQGAARGLGLAESLIAGMRGGRENGDIGSVGERGGGEQGRWGGVDPPALSVACCPRWKARSLSRGPRPQESPDATERAACMAMFSEMACRLQRFVCVPVAAGATTVPLWPQTFD